MATRSGRWLPASKHRCEQCKFQTFHKGQLTNGFMKKKKHSSHLLELKYTQKESTFLHCSAETAYWANASTCWDRSCNVTSNCPAEDRERGKRQRNRNEKWEEMRKKDRKEWCEVYCDEYKDWYINTYQVEADFKSVKWDGLFYSTNMSVTEGTSSLLVFHFLLLGSN